MPFDGLPERLARLLKIDASRAYNGTPCWTFIGRWTTGNGYGKTLWRGSHRVIHRVVWMILRGAICPGMQLDHRCRNRACSNPDHLEPAFPVVNTARGRAVLFRRKADYLLPAE